jgi:hypothetical protein
MKKVFRISVKSICMVLLLTQFNMQSQETTSLTETSHEIRKEISIPDSYTVKGVIVDEDNLPLSGANIVLKGTAEGTTADIDGKFEFPRPLEAGDILVFSYIGFDSQEYTVEQSDSEIIDITITFDYSNINLMGEVVVGGAYASKRNIFQKIADLFRK